MNNEELQKRKIDILVRNLNSELRRTADRRVNVDLEIEDITKRSDRVKRLKLHVLEQDDANSSTNRAVDKNKVK